MEILTLMEIEIQLYAFLKHYLPKGTKGFSCNLQLNDGMTVLDVFKRLNISDEVIKNIMILMVNGIHAKKSQILSDGDVLTVLPIAAGG